MYTLHVHSVIIQGEPCQSWGRPVTDADIDACEQYLQEYVQQRSAPATRLDAGGRITRGDLSHPDVPAMRAQLASCNTPTKENALAIFKVVKWGLVNNSMLS
jgi:hypothetical protein